MTYDEDNRFLANPALRTEPLDWLKFIPFSGTNAAYCLSFGTFIRERVEYFSEPNWGSGPPGSAYFMQRYQVHAGQKSNASYIGNQTGAQLQWKLNRHLTFMLDYEHFFPGAFLQESTAGKSVDYFTAWLDLRI